jgi:hypothetical protein
MTGYESNGTCLTGNCQFCAEKGDCVLLSVFQKVENLEKTVAEMKSHSAA